MFITDTVSDKSLRLPGCDLVMYPLLGQALGVTDVGPDVVALVSHATQEFLRGLLEKLTVMAEHRKPTLKVKM